MLSAGRRERAKLCPAHEAANRMAANTIPLQTSPLNGEASKRTERVVGAAEAAMLFHRNAHGRNRTHDAFPPTNAAPARITYADL